MQPYDAYTKLVKAEACFLEALRLFRELSINYLHSQALTMSFTSLFSSCIHDASTCHGGRCYHYR